MSPSSVPELGVARFWCAEGYERVGFSKYGCYGGVMSGAPTCVRMFFLLASLPLPFLLHFLRMHSGPPKSAITARMDEIERK